MTLAAVATLVACSPRPGPDPPVPPPAPGPPPPVGDVEQGTEPVDTDPPPRSHAEILAEARAHEAAAEQVEVPVEEGATPLPPPPPENVPSAMLPEAPRPLSELATTDDGRARETILLVDDLLFAPGTPELDAEVRRRLDSLVERLLVEGGDLVLEVQGHTDSIGDEAWNQSLALRRAEAVRGYLLEAIGLASERIAAVAVGAATPVADNSTAGGRARNRRVTVLVLR